MTCNCFEYEEMTENMFYGVPLTDDHLNRVTEKIRRYIVNGGAGELMNHLGIGVREVTREALLLPPELIRRRFIWISGARKGQELTVNEIIGIGMFLEDGAFEKFFDKE